MNPCALPFAVLFLSTALAVQPAFESEVSIRIEGALRKTTSNGIPEHDVGQFPNRRNPNIIAPQKYSLQMPAGPKIAAHTTPVGMGLFGVAVNGVVFDAAAAEWWKGDRNSGWQYEPLGGGIDLGVDASNAHVQPNGAYHYHGMPNGLVQKLMDGKPAMALLGWAADGFPIYGPWGRADAKDAKSELRKMKPGYQVKGTPRNGGPGGNADGTFVADYEYKTGLGDLDECNGRFGVTPEFPHGIYHYYITDAFPFIPRLYKGTPDPSFQKKGPPPGGGRRGGPGGRRGPGGRDDPQSLESLLFGPFPF